ncbi:MAG: DUF2007 domain-containing protein [Gemmatimonadetes bacterium]|nr:DUF2007 domain-containing protein [Gemmatimonadota bacterium]NIS01018.1 DUF2007 domain-containing protein [Gemmatimonadota bacterium]NIT66646.1 DUF2007 domain-containing protein [Gemmatimonadota bacterium]NIU51642.1 hypothetical protein [Gemmatimonadota bacterium]NIV23168.1 hypothetical protein [Gemmatimonadota bacterium]
MRLVKVGSFPSRVEAGLAAGILESNGIMHTIRADDVGIFGPGHQGPFHKGVDLLVAETDLAEALSLLQDAGLLE